MLLLGFLNKLEIEGQVKRITLWDSECSGYKVHVIANIRGNLVLKIILMHRLHTIYSWNSIVVVCYCIECSQWHIGMQDPKLSFPKKNTGGVFLIHYKSPMRDNMCCFLFHPSSSALSSLTVHFSAPMSLITVYFTRRENITPQSKEIHLTSFHLGSFMNLVSTAHSKAITLQFYMLQSAYVQNSAYCWILWENVHERTDLVKNNCGN